MRLNVVISVTVFSYFFTPLGVKNVIGTFCYFCTDGNGKCQVSLFIFQEKWFYFNYKCRILVISSHAGADSRHFLAISKVFTLY